MSTRQRRVLTAMSFLILAATGFAVAAQPAAAAPASTTYDGPSMSAVMTISDSEVLPGESFTIQIDVTSKLASAGTASIRMFAAPPNTTILDLDCGATTGVSSCTQDQSNPPQTDYTVEIPVAGGATESATLHYDVREDVVAPTTKQLVFEVGITGGSGGYGAVLPLTVESVPQEADLAVDLQAAAGPLLASQITYQLTVANTGPDEATASSVEFALPHKVYSVSNLPAGCSYASSTDIVVCDVGAIASGDEASRSFKANIALLAIGSLNATATRVSSSPSDPNPANDTSSAHCASLTGVIITC
ncbi:DUF11 domain-containing protein [Isoptericola aurantiacus]|uniref:DUF11 domain-containing protein n=1 Tax=Isoptericola aurantiacus TaxID=3377839 RepID=UPI00383BB2D2